METPRKPITLHHYYVGRLINACNTTCTSIVVLIAGLLSNTINVVKFSYGFNVIGIIYVIYQQGIILCNSSLLHILKADLPPMRYSALFP